jgi:hypothetical protein
MFSVRYGLPLAIFVLGFVLLVIDGGGTRGWEGVAMSTGAALSVWLFDRFYRLSASDEGDREAEEAARDYFSRTGHWPDEVEPEPDA